MSKQAKVTYFFFQFKKATKNSGELSGTMTQEKLLIVADMGNV